ncbi:MAG: tetratricopeptide repeat protein [Phaeodactylibacter sp.]|uniref:tetratricopeptide repeat protein n=1 Tax=Phaeodactylibacter sp. TaxID=1940289 RepID=UPI0032EB9B18
MYALRTFLFASLILFAPVCLVAGKYFHFTVDARTAYEKATDLRFGEAYALLAKVRLQEPDNLIVHHIENYIDFFKLYINENEEDYKVLKAKRDRRLETIANNGDPNSPYYRFVQADIRLQWALVRLRFEDYIGAFTEVSKAYKLLRENEALYPDFMPNKKDLGILHAMVGTIPDSYKWGIKLLGGLEGTIEEGRREVEAVLEYAKSHDFVFEKETKVLYAMLLLHLENKGDAAWKAVNKAGLSPRQSPLHCFVLAHVAMRTGRNDQAIEVLQLHPKNGVYFNFPYLDYMLGLAKLRRLDSDAAPYFQQYLKAYNGRNFIKETYQKLGWQALINGNQEGYKRHMLNCIAHGDAVAGGDKNAQQEATAGIVPNLDLLRARLLFDGGYFQKGYQLLAVQQAANFKSAHELEYYYRLGRLLHGMEQYEEALRHYQLTLDKGADSPWFYACNAALQMGVIYEELDERTQARQAYERCLSLRPEEYRVGLHQKAKAGLARLQQ